ncbi:MAG: hypothetical protein V4647_14530 [Pseudomonadota bacterium]
MSKQMAISAAASIFAMVAFVLVATPAANVARIEAGASAFASAPAGVEAVASLPLIGR